MGAPRRPAPGLTFAPGRGNVEIRYTGLSFVSPERMIFRYRLDSTDQAGSTPGTRRVAYYTSLPPGPHRFEVVACNADGTCVRQPAALSFHLEPHFYQTWWLEACSSVCSIGASAIAIYRWRVRALKAHQRELAERIEERTRDLQQEIAEHKRTEDAARTSR